MKSFRQIITERVQDINFLKMRFKDAEYRDVFQWMEKNARYLGSGAQGRAYTGEDGTWVCRIAEHWGAYEDFIERARSMNNPLVPKVQAMFQTKDGGSVVFIEYLRIPAYNRTVRKIFKSAYLSWRDGRPPSKLVKPWLDKNGVKMDDLEEVFAVIHHIADTSGGKIDLSSDNIGFREDGQMVLFDPIG